jgi:hypothetical protein
MNDLSGYGELTLRGKLMPFKFGTNAYRLFCKHRGIDLSDIGEAFKDPFAILELAFFAYQTAVRMNGDTPHTDLDTFIDMVGDEQGIMSEFEKLIVTSKMWGYTVNDIAEGAKKKS